MVGSKFIIYSILLVFIVGVVHSDKFCGTSLEDAQSQCWQPCTTDEDCQACVIAYSCYEAGSSCGSNNKEGTNHYYCGLSWCDAAYKCTTPCPNGGMNVIDGVEESECPEGETCFADIPCDSNAAPVPVPAIPPPPTSSPYQFCGSTLADAQSQCWQPCPRGYSDCCLGLSCFDTTQDGGTCSSSDYSGTNHFYCGKSWCDAAFSCGTPCPNGGVNIIDGVEQPECPNGQFCYADVPCNSNEPPFVPPQPVSSLSKYCGTSEADAAENCWQPCRDDSDCCFDQTCFTDITSCSYPANQGSEHFFCGEDFCGASFECSTPCPMGFDADTNVRSIDILRMDYGLPRSALKLLRSFRPDGVVAVDDFNLPSCHPPFSISTAYWSGDLASVKSDSGQKFNYKCINEPYDGVQPSDSKYWTRTEACGAALMRFSVLLGSCTLAVIGLLL
eukprot:scaffold4850_cov136-Skeletonema_menzelii.AAC.4